LRALPQEALQDMDKALQLNSINVSKWQAAMIVIQGRCSLRILLVSLQFHYFTAGSAVLSFVIEHELLYS
jgi:hypothetical protein